MHLTCVLDMVWLLVSFNSLCLGFFHASGKKLSRKNSEKCSFNSLCLGFFHASQNVEFFCLFLFNFQFPLFGIFPCILSKQFAIFERVLSFNSLCLGFFHASQRCWFRGQLTSASFNSLCLGFFHASKFLFSPDPGWTDSFNSLCLGFFHASRRQRRQHTQSNPLSIPFVWDFSMHRWLKLGNGIITRIFQFPLFGIFPCILFCWAGSCSRRSLSIPFVWDFSMHLI